MRTSLTAKRIAEECRRYTTSAVSKQACIRGGIKAECVRFAAAIFREQAAPLIACVCP
jgi:hypothetical protein